MTTPTVQEIIKEITYKPKERFTLFMNLESKLQPIVLMRLSKHVQTQLLSELKKETVLPILEWLDPDDTTDLLQLLPKRKQKELLADMSEELQNTLSMLLQFDPRTAAGLMSLNFVTVDAQQKLSEVVEQIRVHEKRTGKLPVSLVLEDQKLIGYLPMHELLFAKPSDLARDLAKKLRTIKHTSTSEVVVNQFLENPHKKIAVLGDNNAILGVLYSDDVLRALQENKTSSLYDFAGLSAEESVLDSAKSKVKHRYKWLIINLATAFLAAFTVSLFDETISKYVILAVYMPIVAGMGGNAATQTLAVLVRGISLRQIELKTGMLALKRELGAAFVNGIITGAIVFGIVMLFNRDVKIAFVLGSAMITNLLVAGFFGTLVPLIMKKLGKDPATSATIFITTATDVLGFLAFLGLAAFILG